MSPLDVDPTTQRSSSAPENSTFAAAAAIVAAQYSRGLPGDNSRPESGELEGGGARSRGTPDRLSGQVSMPGAGDIHIIRSDIMRSDIIRSDISEVDNITVGMHFSPSPINHEALSTPGIVPHLFCKIQADLQTYNIGQHSNK